MAERYIVCNQEEQPGNILQKANFSSCSQLSRLNYGRAFSILPSQGDEIGRFNLNNSHENKTIRGLSLLNVEIHHYFKQLDTLSSPLLPRKLRRRVTIYSFWGKLFVAKIKYKSWKFRRLLCSLSVSVLRWLHWIAEYLVLISPGLLHNNTVEDFRCVEMISQKYSIVLCDLKETRFLNEMKHPLSEN